jgi:hypothetical protein
LVLSWLNKAVKLLSILINTLWTHTCSAFTKDLPVIKIRVAHLFSVLCSPIMCLYVLGSVLWLPHTNDGWFVLYLHVVCKRAHVLLTLFVFACGQWCPTNIVFVFCLFLFGFYSLSCVTCVANFYGLSIVCYHFSILYRLLTLAH